MDNLPAWGIELCVLPSAGQAMRFLADIPASRDSRVVLVMNPLSPSSVPSLLEILVQLGLKQADAAGRQAVGLVSVIIACQ